MTKKDLIKQAEKLWKEACVQRWGTKCEICGGAISTIHHYVKRSQSNLLKYDVENGVPVCVKCHALLHWSKIIKKLELQIEMKRGKKWQKYIHDKIGVLTKTNKPFYVEQIDNLKKLLLR